MTEDPSDTGARVPSAPALEAARAGWRWVMTPWLLAVLSALLLVATEFMERPSYREGYDPTLVRVTGIALLLSSIGTIHALWSLGYHAFKHRLGWPRALSLLLALAVNAALALAGFVLLLFASHTLP